MEPAADHKQEVELAERGQQGVDPNESKDVTDYRVEVTPADNRRLLRKTDRYILSVLIIVYFLQVIDKTNMGYANVLGLSADLKLVGNQYSLVNIIVSAAQLGWQPFSSYLLVRVPPRYLMTALVFLWGSVEAGLGGCSSFGSLMALRFFLGLFEAGCLPLFSLMTAQWYRRSEQPMRVAAWYSMNGVAAIIMALISYGLSHIQGGAVHPWQALFITCGVLTVLGAPLVWFFVDSTVADARFFTEDEKAQAVERLRANQTGVGSNEFKWQHIYELFYDIKSLFWVGIALLINAGTAVASSFGPTLINNFGFDKYVSSLLNAPFGFLQLVVILFSSWAAQKMRSKAIPLALLQIPGIIGCALLYHEGTSGNFRQSVALGGYYLLAFNFGCNPLLVSWMVANTAGQTKKSAIMSLYQAGSAAGNIVGPLLFNAKDAPYYIPGIRGCLGIFAAQLVCVGLQAVTLYLLNRVRRRQRVAHGKPEFIKDTSMDGKYQQYASGDETLGQNALLDLTDYQNDEFVYVY
ncbi:hypothetical protein EHS25_000336 [Saitozyma podzolica]|uniref:Major facilitator superfamily (MFS) profile domain-containing protein n=1 Tax=Saitozyma podzolica TaxID=1890683 RepID=A0A427YVU7_9TREE|nr:hypothetical protein EHS25_000336 [Saitozyma podzolica]